MNGDNDQACRDGHTDVSMKALKVVGSLLFILLFPVLIMVLSGDVTWTEEWIFSVWFIILCYATILYLYRKDPALLEERYKKPRTGNEEGWDRYVVAGLMIGFTAWMIVMPLDAKRYGWSPDLPIWLKAIGVILLASSFYLFFRSYADNTFLSSLVGIQEEWKQTVVTTGVYGFVRHPMYFGGGDDASGGSGGDGVDVWGSCWYCDNCSARVEDRG